MDIQIYRILAVILSKLIFPNPMQKLHSLLTIYWNWGSRTNSVIIPDFSKCFGKNEVKVWIKKKESCSTLAHLKLTTLKYVNFSWY